MKNVLKTPETAFAANKQLEREMDRLAVSIRRFRIESQRFLGGDLKFSPDELREKISSDFRRLRGASLKGAAVSFRLGTLEAKFQSHLDLFGRRFREREQAESRPATGVEKQATDLRNGVVLGTGADASAVEALFKELYRHNSQMDLERFRSYIHRQAEGIRAKTGCREIRFRIAVQDGKTKLKARPIHHGSST